MSPVPLAAVLQSATFRRAASWLGAIALVATVALGWLMARLDQQADAGWQLGSAVVDLVGDVDAEVCWRMVGSEVEMAAGNAASRLALRPIHPAREDDEPSAPSDLETGETGDGTILCVARESLFDGDTEALVAMAHGIEPPSRISGAVGFLWAFWILASLALVFGGAYRLASSPTALVRDLRRARARIDDGDLAARLRTGEGGGDANEAAVAINAMLDRLDFAVSTLSEVSDNIAHDLRTPLTRLQGQLDLLRRSESPTPEMIEAVQDEASQLLATFNALLRIAQVESGRKRKGFRGFDLGLVIDDAGELYGPAMAEKEIVLDYSVPPRPVEIHGDADLWMQAISNLLDNAMKYTPEGGRVDLRLRPGGPQSGIAAEIRLQDSGDGIPEADLDKVFQRFYRLSGHRKLRGSGLGLSLVAAICELHRSRIELANRDGLEVTIEIPSREENPVSSG